MGRTRIFVRFSKEYNSEIVIKGEQSFLCKTHLIDISIKYHEDILKIIYRRTVGRTAPCHNTSRFFFQNGRIITEGGEGGSSEPPEPPLAPPLELHWK